MTTEEMGTESGEGMKIAFERVPEEGARVDYFLDDGTEVPKRSDQTSETFEEAIARSLREQDENQDEDEEEEEGDEKEGGEGESVEMEEGRTGEEPPNWERILSNIALSCEQTQRMVDVLTSCEAGQFILAHAKRAPPQSASLPSSSAQVVVGSGGVPSVVVSSSAAAAASMSSSVASAAVLAFARKREALKVASERLREASTRATAGSDVRDTYIEDVTALGRAWRLVPLTDNGAHQQIDCSLPMASSYSDPATTPIALPTPKTPRVVLVRPNLMGEATVTAQKSSSSLGIRFTTATSDKGSTQTEKPSAGNKGRREATGTAVGASDCHGLLCGLQNSLFSECVFETLRDDAVHAKPSQTPSLHVSVEGDRSIVASCGPSTSGFRVSVEDVRSDRFRGKDDADGTDSANVEFEEQNLHAHHCALVAVVEELVIEKWRLDSELAAKEGIVPQKDVVVVGTKATSKAANVAAAQNVGQQRPWILESVAALEAHFALVARVCGLLEEFAKDSPGTCIHWGRTYRSPVPVSPFVIVGTRRSVRGCVEGQSIRVEGLTVHGLGLLSQCIRSLLS